MIFLNHIGKVNYGGTMEGLSFSKYWELSQVVRKLALNIRFCLKDFSCLGSVQDIPIGDDKVQELIWE